MYDILVYVYENYFASGSYPDAAILQNKLFAAGFERGDIDRALDWLTCVDRLAQGEYDLVAGHTDSIRCFSGAEMSRLGPEGWGFLSFLENSGILDPVQRECIIDSVLTLPESRIGLPKLKLIVLMVLWRRGYPLDALLIDELTGEIEPSLH